MNRKILCLLLVAFTIILAVGCGGSDEDSPLLLSSQELDGVFNPFFSSSAFAMILTCFRFYNRAYVPVLLSTV